MIDIDFIKWMCEKADGFDLWDEGDDIFPDWCLYHNGYGVDPLSGDFKETAQCQLLLQRAIEGVNSEVPAGMRIFEVVGMTSERYLKYGNTNTIALIKIPTDKAKEMALKYTYEQESKQ